MIKNQKRTILIVDDNDKTLQSIEGLGEYFDILFSVELSEVMKAVHHKQVDLLLLDMMIPKISGFDLCKLLKQNDDTKNIPIIFLTDNPNFEDIQKGFELGAIDYIVKPFSSKEFYIRIMNHLELSSYRTQLENKVAETLQEYNVAQKMLLQKSKQAEIGELMMHIAHQWKQPLSELGSINNYLMAKNELDKEISKLEYNEILQNNAQIIRFMSQTVSTFQNFYNPNSCNEFFLLHKAIEDAYGLVNATFDYCSIQYSCELDKTIDIFGNRNEFSQILLALFINAKNIFLKRKIDAPTITVTLKNRVDDCVVTVEDNGGGILQEELEHIFNPFISDESTGMGLFMVKNICEKNNWEIKVENKDDGALFSITIKQENKHGK